MVLGDVALRHRLYLAAKPSHMGVVVDGLAFPLRRPTVCNYQTRGQGFLSSAAFSRRGTVDGGDFLRDAKPPDLDI
jgi:hypothetical protein